MEYEYLQELSREWLEEAGQLALSIRSTSYRGTLKKDATPVTEIDIALERLLRERISSIFPEHGISGEEFPPIQPKCEHQWLIDPIDGTRALMAGFNSFTILLAMAKKDIPYFGAVYQPITRELWFGCQQQQSFQRQQLISTRSCPTIAEAFFSTTSPLLFSVQQQETIIRIIKNCKAYQLGGDAYAYAKLAEGNIDLIIESGLKPYDFMPLIPLIEGAGGIISDWQGRPLSLHSNGNILAAGDNRLYQAVLPLLQPLKA